MKQLQYRYWLWQTCSHHCIQLSGREVEREQSTRILRPAWIPKAIPVPILGVARLRHHIRSVEPYGHSYCDEESRGTTYLKILSCVPIYFNIWNITTFAWNQNILKSGWLVTKTLQIMTGSSRTNICFWGAPRHKKRLRGNKWINFRLQYPREKMGSHFGTLCKFSKVTKPIFKKTHFRQTSLCKFSKLQNPFSSPKLQTPVFKGYKTFSQVGQSPIFFSVVQTTHFLKDPFLSLSLRKKLEKLSHLLEKTHFLENPFSREGTVMSSDTDLRLRQRFFCKYASRKEKYSKKCKYSILTKSLKMLWESALRTLRFWNVRWKCEFFRACGGLLKCYALYGLNWRKCRPKGGEKFGD